MLSYDNALRSIGHGEICLGPVIKVVNSREVREVQEGATCFSDKKPSKFG